MKRFVRIRNAVLLLVLAVLLVDSLTACSQASSDSNDKDGVTFSEGWWKHSSSVAGGTTTYIKYDANESILRAGTNTEEYSSGYLDNTVKKILAFDTLKSSNSFTKIADTDTAMLPSWATASSGQITFSAGWWKYLRYSNGAVYIEYDTDKKVLRVGADNFEYHQDDLQTSWDFDTTKNSLAGDIGSSFTKITDTSSLPLWVTN